MPPFRRASTFLCYILKKDNPSVFRRKKFRLPYPSTSYASLILQIPNFGEKSWKNFPRVIAFGRYPFPSVSYVLEILKSKNCLDFFTNLFEGTPSFQQLCIENGRNGHFSVLSEKFFPPSDSHGRSRNLALFISSLYNCYPESRKNLQVSSPSDSYVFEREKNPNFELLFWKNFQKHFAT